MANSITEDQILTHLAICPMTLPELIENLKTKSREIEIVLAALEAKGPSSGNRRRAPKANRSIPCLGFGKRHSRALPTQGPRGITAVSIPAVMVTNCSSQPNFLSKPND